MLSRIYTTGLGVSRTLTASTCTLKTKAQLQFTLEDYEGALATVRDLMANISEPSADVLMLEGQALFQLAR